MLNFGTGIAAADVDNDGILDLLGTEYTTGTLAVFRGNGAGGVGNGTFAGAIHIPAGPEPYDVEAADFDADGKIDPVVSNTGAGGLRLLRGLGNGSFTDQGNIATGILADAEAADYDGDGILDLFVVFSSPNRFSLFKGNGAASTGTGSFALVRDLTANGFPVCVVAGDLNEDGALDAAFCNYLGVTTDVTLTACTVAPPSFQIVRVRDVPRDQGGRVFVTWNRHPSDIVNGSITGYRVWRQVPNGSAQRTAASAAIERRTTLGAAGPIYWEAAATLPAQRFESYGFTAETAQDSMAGSNPSTLFFVTATTANLETFFDTPIDSGYSVDNLPPLPPSQVTSRYLTGSVQLHWQPNLEADLLGYTVHQGSAAFFVPSDANRVSLAGGLGYTDGLGTPSTYYKVAAVDVHGNIGAFVLVEPNGPVGIELALLSSEPRPGDVELVWYPDSRTIPVADLERSESQGVWQVIDKGTPDASGRLEFHDRGARLGGDYAYRLRWMTPVGTRFSPEVAIRVPGLELALSGASPNPASTTRLSLRFSLRDASPAALELYDAAGRRVVDRAVGGLGAGTHTLSLADAALQPGVYLARLRQGSETRRVRVVVVR